MFENIHFIRTTKGEELFINKELIALNYKTHMVLNLCNGKFAYAFLKSNIKRVNNLDEIIQYLLQNALITASTTESVRQFEQNRALLGSAYIEKRSNERILSSLESNFDISSNANAAPLNSTPQNINQFNKAISFINNALGEHFSDEVLAWSMQAESCNCEADFNLLLDSFRVIYTKLVSSNKASEIIQSAMHLL